MMTPDQLPVSRLAESEVKTMNHARNHNAKHHGHQRKSRISGPPVMKQFGGAVPTAVATGRGLDSRLVRKQVLDVLNPSEWHEVERLFNELGFRSSKTGGDGRSGLRETAVEQEAKGYVQTERGREEVWKRIDQMVREMAGRELNSDAGRQKVERVMAVVFAERLSEDADAFSRACRQEVARLVERWLNSPAGKEHVEVARQRAAQNAAGQGASGRHLASSVTRWVQQPLPTAPSAGGSENG
jgi:hypothetical protein